MPCGKHRVFPAGSTGRERPPEEAGVKGMAGMKAVTAS